MIWGTKFQLLIAVMKSHLNGPQIIFKFPRSNTLLWRMTELQGINVTVPSGYLCDITLLDCQELNQRRLLKQRSNEHTHTHPAHHSTDAATVWGHSLSHINQLLPWLSEEIVTAGEPFAQIWIANYGWQSGKNGHKNKEQQAKLLHQL